MPQTIIQYDKELDEKIENQCRKLDMSKADTIVELLKTHPELKK